ncbi:MAG: protein-export membrane protein SecF [Candidatus Melainabacteria bacterium RIFCSPHIGHO2_02_FULL_34_12]|nr:MAG: protein-export membrane protein SecF [Candidatus Melainabacteria bacterium RIFCSPHIGHO2_02_FULL_34_12]
MKVDIVKYRWFWFGFSLAVLIPGLIAIGFCFQKFGSPLKLGLDFTGGTKLEYRFPHEVKLEEVRAILDKHKLGGSNIQLSKVASNGSQVVVIRSKAIKQRKSSQTKASQKEKIDEEFTQTFGNFEILSIDTVSPIIGPELLNSGLLALFFTLVGIVIYISYRFRKDYAICAIIAMIHDVFVLVGLFAIFSFFWGLEIDSLFITAVLTVIGFSIHDTIVVFDRIRENSKFLTKNKTFGEIANDSINQTLIRSINTSLTTLIALGTLYLFGGETTKTFVGAMFLGIASGTYSSIFVASALLVWWREIVKKKRLKSA